MDFDGIKGDVTTADYKGWIELNSFQFGVSRGVESSSPSISEIVVSKYLDSASPKLYQDSLAGAFDTKVTIKMTSTTKNKVETFLTYELTDCGVSSYSQSSGGDAPVESLSLNFVKIMMTPTPLDKSGQIKKGDVVTYDLLALKTQ
jgi:type VI secretion system secreted protein Hcp